MTKKRRPFTAAALARITRAVGRKLGRRGNPPPDLDGATLVYPQVEKVFAVKGPASGKLAGPYVHEFKTKPQMYGLANGDLLLTTRRVNRPVKRTRTR